MKSISLFLCLLAILAAPAFPAEEVAQEIPGFDATDRLTALLELSNRYWGKDPDKSFTYAREALALARELDRPEELFQALNRIGGWYYVREQFRDAVEYYLEALKLEPRIREKRLVANLLVNIGMVYWRLGDFEKAEEYQRRSLELRKATNYTPVEMAQTLNNLGLALYEQSKFGNALAKYQDAYDLFKIAGNKRQMAAVLTNLGNVANEMGNYMVAISYFKKARHLYNELGNRWGAANTTLGIAGQYMEMEDYNQAFPYLITALKEANSLKVKDVTRRTYGYLSTLYEKRDNYKKALEYYDKSSDLKKEMAGERREKQSAVMETIYQTGKKTAEMDLLKKAGERDRLIRLFLMVSGVLGLALALMTLLRIHMGKKLNQRLTISRERYQSLFANAGDAILVSRRGLLEDCNRQALEMFGFNHEEMTGKTMADLSPAVQPDGRQSLDAINGHLRKTLSGRPQRFNWKLRKKDGTLFDTTVSLALPDGGDNSLMQAIVHDISDRKRLEDQRVKSAKLETAGLLSGSLARDLNHLVIVMRDNLGSAGMKLEDGNPLARLLRPVENAVNSLDSLSGKFVSIAEGGFLPKKKSSLSTIILNTVESECRDRVRCDRDIATDLWPVVCDVHQIRQMLGSIIRNAADAAEHMESGGHVRVIAANLVTDDKQFISIAVMDNGKGIPTGMQAKIFDPYYSTRDDVTRKGLGMSLAIALSIIRRHGGTIDLVSSPAKGSTFTIVLPTGGGDSQ